jgi:DNA mismatch repair protein MutL
LNQKIEILDELCVNQIAAGEVVERPSSVVKELIENAIDAGARKIEIIIERGGESYLQVKDDGYGMSSADLELAILPHATSKIKSIEDLKHLETLGFRGEALPSIAAVSKLSIISRQATEIGGHEIRVEGGKVVSFTEIGCPQGTTVTVKDLFYNTPARRKFLRSANTEAGLISDLVSRLALANPNISFSLRRSKNQLLYSPGKGNLRDTIAAVYGAETARQMLELSVEKRDLRISGYLSSPNLVRSSRNSLTFIVNGRVVRSQLLNQALRDGYHTLIPAKTYPFAVVVLTMPASNYDVNVHPAKLEIKFNNEKNLAFELTTAIRQTLLQTHPVRSTILEQDPYITLPESTLNGPKSQGASIDSQNLSLNICTANENKIPFLVSESADPSPVKTQGLFQELRALGQLFNMYLLCTDDKNLYVIDQHAAHERLRYDELTAQLKEQGLTSQMLLFPEVLELTPHEESILLENLEELQSLGFIIENYGARAYFLRAVPTGRNLREPGSLFREFIAEVLAKSRLPSSEKLLEEWIYMVACRTALKLTLD